MAPTIPKTARAVVLDAPGAPFKIREVPVHLPERNEILIKVLACGVCHSDTFLQQGAFGAMASFPRVPGHEMIGDVVAVGSGVTDWHVGDRVGGAWHGGHDGTCKACNRGLFQMCDNAVANGINRDGGYAEYCTLRSEAAVRVPADVDPAAYAPLLCAGVTTYNSLRNMNITAGDVVAIQGIGGLGHLAIQYARKMGFRTVALSTNDSKREFARQLGANEYINTSKEDASEALQKMGGASCIIVTAPSPAVMGPLVGGLGPRGKLLILAAVGDIPVDTVKLMAKGASVHGWPAGHALDSEEAMSFALHQDVNCLIEKFPFDKVQDAIEHMESGKVRFRSVLVMD